MGKSRGHFTHGSQSRHVNEFGLQFLKPCIGLLSFRQIADEPSEEALIANTHFADRKLHGKRRAVAALADHYAANADNPPFTGAHVASEIAVVVFTVRRRHQYPDALSQCVRGATAEQPFRRRTERLYAAALIYDDHGVGNAVENRL